GQVGQIEKLWVPLGMDAAQGTPKLRAHRRKERLAFALGKHGDPAYIAFARRDKRLGRYHFPWRWALRYGPDPQNVKELDMAQGFDLEGHGITVKHIIRNAAPSVLYEAALQNEEGSAISATGALVAMSGEKTGRSPKDKR